MALTKAQKAEAAKKAAEEASAKLAVEVNAKALELSGAENQETFDLLPEDEKTKFIDEAKDLLIQNTAKEDKVEEGLVRMTKDGEVLDVHQTCVADHQKLGWTVKA